MQQDPDLDERLKSLGKAVGMMVKVVVGLFLLVIFLFSYIAYTGKGTWVFEKEPVVAEKGVVTEKPKAVQDTFWHAPDIASLEGNPAKEQILYGKDLIANTSKYFGPKGKVKANATNGMNCQNCHLDAGTRVFGNNYGSVFATYPKYRPRSGTIENIYKRVTDCFERSLNGTAPDSGSKEMEAIVAYINWLGKDVKKGEKAVGSGLKDLAYLDRAADPEKGKAGYEKHCVSCHTSSGQGMWNGDSSSFTFPPLWGIHSYNSGAGLYRLGSLAKYIKYNMPQGVTHDSPKLTDEEAWDIAAFVNSQTRPTKDIRKDWPKINEKPIDHPFGPYHDGFTEAQHKFGPFKPIVKKRKELEKEKAKNK
ncbi:MAG: c-type cytochrome [Bacteroidota bacterium]